MIFSFSHASAVAHSCTQASSRALHALVTVVRRTSCPFCVAVVVARAVVAASSSLLFTVVVTACYSLDTRLEVEVVLALVMARELAATGVSGG
jgi:hypothetical protein